MTAIGRLQPNTLARPLLRTFVRGGKYHSALVDPFRLRFQVWNVGDGSAPAQVWPDAIGGWFTATGSQKINVGEYLVPYSPLVGEALGAHKIRVEIVEESGDDPVVFEEPFEVLSCAAPAAELYAFVSDLREEGLTTTMANDIRAVRLLSEASRYIERITGRRFYLARKALQIDGNGGRALMLTEPVVAVAGVHLATSPLFPSDLAIEADFFRVYNRHIREGLTVPDDRNNPKVELFSSSEDLAGARPFTFSRLIFPRGQQNVTLTGLFGYTEPDGYSQNGVTPSLLRLACMKLVFRNRHRLGAASGADALNANRIVSESTREQSYTLDKNNPARGTSFTGDPEIDQLLASFMRPPMIAGA